MPDRQSRPPAGRLARPTAAAVGVLVVASMLEAVSNVIGSGWFAFTAAIMIGAVAAAAALTPAVATVEVTRVAPRRMTAGVPAQIHLRLQTRRRWMPGSIVVTDATDGLPTVTAFVPSLRAGAPATATVPVMPAKRGHGSGTVILLEGRSPFGGFHRRTVVMIESDTVVHPARAAAMSLPAGSSSARPASPATSAGDEDVSGVRDWRPGDSRSAVHPRTSARRGRPVVLERERPAPPALTIALGQLGSGPEWESLVARVAATVVAEMAAGVRVVLVSGTGVVRPTAAVDALDWFADLERLGTTTSAAAGPLRRHDADRVGWLGRKPGADESPGPTAPLVPHQPTATTRRQEPA